MTRTTRGFCAIGALLTLTTLATTAHADGRNWNDGPVVNVAAMPILRGDHSVLAHEVRRYRRGEIRPDASAAMYQCEQGKYSEAIPVLEDGLIMDKIPLPAPGYRWPGESWIQHRV